MFGNKERSDLPVRRHRLPDNEVSEYVPPIRLRSIDGHLTRTADEVYAWYRLSPQRWSFRSDAERSQLISDIASQYAELGGRWLHLRVTARPYPVTEWARAHANNAVERLPDVEGAIGWEDYLVGEQHRVAGAEYPVTEKEVYLGVQVQARSLTDRLADALSPVVGKVWRSAGESLATAELTSLQSEVAWLDQIVASRGLAGRPVSPEEMSWLMYRSCGLGLPPPQWRPPTPLPSVDASDLAGFAESAAAYHEPYAPTVTVRGCTGANAGVTRSVVVCSVGQMDSQRIPEAQEPWMQRADRLGAVEISARIKVCRHEEVYPKLARQMSKVRSQVRHYTVEHELEPPQSLSRQANQVLAIEDEMSLGFTARSTRVQSWWRVAVSAPSDAEALAAARRLSEIYKPQIAIEHPAGQYALAREFIPGEPLASAVHQRRGSVTWAAAAVPQATASIGDRQGILLGQTAAATTAPVTWDPWMGQEVRDSSGLTAILGGLGSGKSYLAGGIVYKTLRAGARWDVLDPSGQLTALCALPELRPYARAINLLDAEPGILNPYRVVAEPEMEHFADDRDPERSYQRECAIAAAARRRLVLDVLTGLLPYDIARLAETRIVLLRAVRAVGGHRNADLSMVFDALRGDASENREHAQVVADFCDEMRDRLALLIPEADTDPYAGERDDRLTVLTMNGLVLPKEGVSREHWTDAETLGIQLLNLAAWLVQRSVYDRPRDERKGVWIDEAFFLSQVATGRVLMDRFNRDSRKWNIRVLLSSQIPSDFLNIQGFASLVDSVFVGQLTDGEAQSDALRLLGVARNVGYEQELGRLGASRTAAGAGRPSRDTGPRKFIFSDGAGGCETVRIDFGGDHLAGLRAALETAPRASISAGAARSLQAVPARALATTGGEGNHSLAVRNGHHPEPVGLGPLAEADLDFDPHRWGEDL